MCIYIYITSRPPKVVDQELIYRIFRPAPDFSKAAPTTHHLRTHTDTPPPTHTRTHTDHPPHPPTHPRIIQKILLSAIHENLASVHTCLMQLIPNAT